MANNMSADRLADIVRGAGFLTTLSSFTVVAGGFFSNAILKVSFLTSLPAFVIESVVLVIASMACHSAFRERCRRTGTRPVPLSISLAIGAITQFPALVAGLFVGFDLLFWTAVAFAAVGCALIFIGWLGKIFVRFCSR